MRRHEVPRPKRPLESPQLAVASLAGSGFAGLGSQAKPYDVAWQAVSRCERLDVSRHIAARGRNAVIDMGHDQLEGEFCT
jgi:hypothetical protein